MEERRLLLPVTPGVGMAMGAAIAVMAGAAGAVASFGGAVFDRGPDPTQEPSYRRGRSTPKRRHTKGVTWGKFKGSNAARRPAREAQKLAKAQGRARRCARRVGILTRGW